MTHPNSHGAKHASAAPTGEAQVDPSATPPPALSGVRKGWTRGEDRPAAKLTEGEVIDIRRSYVAGQRLKELALAYPQVSKVNLHHIIHQRRWQFLPSCDALANEGI